MDDIGFLGEIDPDKDEVVAIAKLYVETDEGEKMILSYYTVDKKVPLTLYLPSLNRTLHRKFVGTSPDGSNYYTFALQNLYLAEFTTARYELLESGWTLTFDSRED